VDGCIAIGEIEDLALIVGAPLLARVERPSGDPGAIQEVTGDPTVLADGPNGDGIVTESTAALDGEGEEDKDRVRRVPAWAPWLGVAAGLLLAWLAWGSLASPDTETISEATSPPAELVVESGDVADSSPGDATSAREAANAAVDAEIHDGGARIDLFTGPVLTYSVLVASFARLEDAERQMSELDRGAALFLVAPTPIRERTYYRILAGAIEDRVDAETLMRDLVDAGLKEEVRGWDVRPVRFAFDLGTYEDRRSADRRIDQLAEFGIHAYRLADGFEEPRSWRVYAGAYETEQAAVEFGRTLSELGETAILVPRTGRPR
jgi:hypothetical protein